MLTTGGSYTLLRPMKYWFRRRLVTTLCAVACVAVAASSLWPRAVDVRSADRNGDGRADAWYLFDRQGRLSQVTIDTNFDGRPDVRELYEHGVLVRRESDRDLNDRVDLVQEFDPTTHEYARSITDVDFDGTADLLVLFQGGRPVFSEWAHQVAQPAPRTGTDLHAETFPGAADRQLASLEDPFRHDLSVRAARGAAGSGDWVVLSTPRGLPAPRTDISNPLASSSDVSDSGISNPSSNAVVPYSPRGPPAAHLPS